MKKFLSMVLVIALSAGLYSCGGSDEKSETVVDGPVSMTIDEPVTLSIGGWPATEGDDLTRMNTYKADFEAANPTEGMLNYKLIFEKMKEYTKEFNVPDERELKNALLGVNYNNITVDGNNITLSGNSKIDLGGIAKGFLSDRIIQIYRENGIESGIVSLGGNVQTLGRKPDGKLWRVAIQNPDNENVFLGVLSIEHMAVITSGGYQRYFEKDGITYHYIINPNDGFPADSGLKSVTVVSESGTLADGLSTSFYIMGLEKSIEYWRANDDFGIIMLTDNDELYITEGLKSVFESDYKYRIITK